MKISFVIPCYKAAKNIQGVIDEIDEAMLARPDFSYEIILVNDASPDNTAEVLKDIAFSRNDVIAIDLSINTGQPNALLAGLNYCSGDYIMTSDDDGQTPVGRVFDFLEELNKGYDVVCARYIERNQPSIFRRFGSALNRGMSDWLIKKPEGVYMAAFFMARRFVVDEIIKYQHPYVYISGLILRTTQRVGNIDIVQRERHSGSSGYNIFRLLSLWLNGLTSFSIKPLRIALYTGVFTALIGFIAAIIIVIRKILIPTIAMGWSSYMVVLLMLSGLMLMFMGLQGEYIGRIYMCINEQPQFVIRNIYRSGGDAETTNEVNSEMTDTNKTQSAKESLITERSSHQAE